MCYVTCRHTRVCSAIFPPILGSNQKARAHFQTVQVINYQLHPPEILPFLCHTHRHTHSHTALFLLPSCFLTPVSISVSSSTSPLKCSSVEFRADLEEV